MADDDTVPDPSPPRLAWVNFALLAAGGLAALAWIWWFTDWLKPALVVVGLGGILAWPRSLVGWLPGIGSGLERGLGRAIGSRVTCAALACALAAGLSASCFVGSVAVRSLEPDAQRRLVFRPDGGLPSAQLFAGDSEVRRPFWTSWAAPARVGVEVGGYPPTEVTVRPWRRARVIVPDDVRRPIVLLRPGTELTFAVAGALKDETRRVVLTVELPAADGDARRTMDYGGRAVWIGCPADCDIPERFAREWEEQPAVLAWRWLTPVELPGPLPLLAAGDRVRARVTIDGETVADTEFTVRGGDEPQLEDL